MLIKKFKIIILISLIFFFLVSTIIFIPGCKEKNEQEIIKIGAILPLTGEAAEFGESERNGALTYMEISAPDYIKLFIEDSQNNSNLALRIFQKQQLEGIKFYLVSMSSISMSLKPHFKLNKNFMISIAAAEGLTEEDYGIIKMLPDTRNQAEEIVGLINKIFSRPPRISLVYVNDDFGLSFKEVIAQKITNLKSFSYSKDEKDFKSVALKVLQEKPEAIVTIGYGSKLGLLIKTIREVGFINTIISSPEVMFDEVKRVAGEFLNNVIAITFDLNKENELYKSFIKAYEDKFGKKPDYDALLGYDCARLLCEGIRILKSNAKEINPKNLKEYFKSKKHFRTFLGEIEIKEDGKAYYDLANYKYVKRKWIKLELNNNKKQRTKYN